MQMQMEMGKGRERGMRMNGHCCPLDHDHHYCITIEESSQPSKYIEHTVSKFDTLAGVAIKYGVEVADIKRINGLVTDHQMFALKTLHIPLPGRHPPSPILASSSDDQRPSSSEQTAPSPGHSDLFNSFQSLKLKPSPQRKMSPYINSLQGYYGLKSTEQRVPYEGFEMSVYQKEGAHYSEDDPFSTSSPPLNPPLSHKRKSKSMANGLSENGDLTYRESRDSDSDRWIEKLTRKLRSEVSLDAYTPITLLKEDNSSGGAFSTLTGKGLALRPKAISRTVSGVDGDSCRPNAVPISLVESFLADRIIGVRKSSSTPSFQESDNNTSSSIRSASKWSLKPDLQALSTAAITRPIFDGLSKPRKSKAALD